MARQKKRKKAAEHRPEPDDRDRALAESRAADAATVGWTLAALCSLAALAFRWLILLMLNAAADPEQLHPATPVIPSLMHFVALVSGVMAISMTPFVYWLRRAAPPWQITAAVLVIGLTPLVLLVLNR